LFFLAFFFRFVFDDVLPFVVLFILPYAHMLTVVAFSDVFLRFLSISHYYGRYMFSRYAFVFSSLLVTMPCVFDETWEKLLL